MSAEIATYASNLLAMTGITKVLSIDDAYSAASSIEEYAAAVMTADQQTLAKISPLIGSEAIDPDVIRKLLREKWDGLSDQARDELASHLTPPEEVTDEASSLENDLEIGTNLPEIFGKTLSMFSLDEWTKRKAEFINDDMPPTLLLIDLSFADEGGGVGEGLTIIKQLFNLHPAAPIYCGLLTNKYSLASIHADWKRLAHENSLSQDRFVLIPKDALREDRRKFLALIKLALINEHARALRTAVGDAYAACLNETKVKLEEIDVYEFERIVCLSSSHEGVWEPDTLSRIFSLFHKKLVRGALHGDVQVHSRADSLRALSDIPVGEWGGPTEMEIKLRRLEWFEDEADVNGQYLPIELGDLFRIGGNIDKLFVLVAQPCDLMVRQDGKQPGTRHHTVSHAMLLEAAPVKTTSETAKNSDLDFGFNLEFYQPDTDWRVNLRKVHYINLDVLDLCAFRLDGQSIMGKDSVAPQLISHAWKLRFTVLKKAIEKMLKRYAELSAIKGLKEGYILKIVSECSFGNLITPKIDGKAGSVTFNLSRIGRLKQPRSGALLARYANSLARDAFEHDLARRPPSLGPHSGEPANAVLIPVLKTPEAVAAKLESVMARAEVNAEEVAGDSKPSDGPAQ